MFDIKVVAKPALDICTKVKPLARKLSPKAPVAMLAGGVALIVGGTGYACVRSVKKMPAILDDLAEERDAIVDEAGEVEALDPEKKRAEVKREIAKAYLRKLPEVGKVYAVPAAMLASGVALTVGAHNVQAKRVAMAYTAYNSLMTTFSEYRSRVVEAEGSDKDLLYLHGEREETVVEQKETKSGKVTEKEKQVKVFGSGDGDDLYHKCFSMLTSTHWRNDPDYNLQFVTSCQRIANQKLKAQGYLFLDEVYELLGFDLEGFSNAKIVGWIDDEDAFIDFRIFCPNAPWDEQAANRAVLKGQRYCDSEIYLDFNCDGIIIDQL